MNRTIKFRGKSLQTGEWFYGYLQQYQEKHAKILCICATSISTWKDALLYEIYPETVGQFTGLLDRNGKEIYEADIVASKYSNPGEVVFSDGQFCVNYNGYCALIPSDAYEIIGNIHDHPELLNSKQ